jgi:hypothetical protein
MMELISLGHVRAGGQPSATSNTEDYMSGTLTKLVFAGITSLALLSLPASAKQLTFKADMKGSTEVPPTDSTGTGTAEVKVDTATKKISWTIKHSGLTGDPTAAHFHGPAKPGENAPPEIDISKKIDSGSAELTKAQLADLEAGKLYVNIHTAKFPDGEIRGQVEKQ